MTNCNIMADVHFQLQFYSYAVQYKMYTCFLDSPPQKKVYTCLPFSKPIFIPFNLFAQYSFMSKAVRSVGNSNSVL